MDMITQKSIGLDGKVFPERRSETRHKVLKGATLSFNKGFSAFECVVRNQSSRGARLSLAETFSVPSHFDVLISGEDAVRRATVRWRSMTAIGVEFE